MAVELLKERFNMKGQGNRQEFSIHKMEAVVLGKYWYQAFVLYWYWVLVLLRCLQNSWYCSWVKIVVLLISVMSGYTTLVKKYAYFISDHRKYYENKEPALAGDFFLSQSVFWYFINQSSRIFQKKATSWLFTSGPYFFRL